MSYRTSTSFYIAEEQTHCVEVKAWSTFDSFQQVPRWQWNVYAHLYETHAWFDKPEILSGNLPLHYGASYSVRKIIEPVLGVQRDWEKRHETITFGSDYGHYTDSENHQSPTEGIPYYVLTDALELVTWLQERATADKPKEVTDVHRD